MMKVLFCSYKKDTYKKNGEYYSTNYWPDFIPRLAKRFEKLYAMAPVKEGRPSYVQKLENPTQLEIVETKPTVHPFLWSFFNSSKFKEIQERVDLVVMTAPSAITYMRYM
ncbi:MAG: hypothetical protein ABEK36_01760, partial [Candidatus Aenigmatarchaeota archaeon]